MASLLKEQKKAKGKRKADAMDVDQEDAPVLKKPRNKQRVLMLSSRGINHRMRHLMNDLETLLPHVKKGAVVFCFAENRMQTCSDTRFQTRLQKPP